MKPITINTHIDCLNNSKCSVRDILLATKQGAFESVFGTFSVTQHYNHTHNNTRTTTQEQQHNVLIYGRPMRKKVIGARVAKMLF